MNPRGTGRNLYFCYGESLTLTSQRVDAIRSDPATARLPLHARADPRFFWNRSLCQPLIEAHAHLFILTAILGFVAQLSDMTAVSKSGATSFSVTLIARRSAQRAGARHWRRGADRDGNVANFVETEQIIATSDGGKLASLVQVNGDDH